MIEIHKSKSKKKPFKVRYDGINGECLAPSQNLTTKENCFVNIRAMAGLFRVDSTEPIKVMDYTGKIPKEIVL
jgi:hypothetical protein